MCWEGGEGGEDEDSHLLLYSLSTFPRCLLQCSITRSKVEEKRKTKGKKFKFSCEDHRQRFGSALPGIGGTTSECFSQSIFTGRYNTATTQALKYLHARAYKQRRRAVAENLSQCCFTSTETIRTIRDGEPWTATSTFTQLLSSVAERLLYAFRPLKFSARLVSVALGRYHRRGVVYSGVQFTVNQGRSIGPSL